MPVRNLDPLRLEHNEDWEGNNAAFTCPLCQKVFIVSHTRMHLGNGGEKGYRKSGGFDEPFLRSRYSVKRADPERGCVAPKGWSGNFMQRQG